MTQEYVPVNSLKESAVDEKCAGEQELSRL